MNNEIAHGAGDNARDDTRPAGTKVGTLPKIRPLGFDHIVLSVADVERSLAFYCGTLGLEPMRVDEWRDKKVRFPSARVNAETIIDLAFGERSGTNLDHFCLVIEPIDFDALLNSGEIEIERGPAVRTGAKGDGHSVYLRDPDQNLVELRYY